MKLKTYLILFAIFSFFFLSTSFAQIIGKNDLKITQSFNVGMFSVVGNDSSSPKPGTEEFRNELREMWEGTSDGYTAINSLQVYGHYISDSTFWSDYLSDISSVSDSLKALADCNFHYINTNHDSLISGDELSTFVNEFENFLNQPNTDHILGWYIADEPKVNGVDSAGIANIYYAIKQHDSRPVYIAEAPSAAYYASYLCDVIMIDNYYYTINSFSDLATLAMWRNLIPAAREQLKSVGRGETEMQALLVLGQEIFPDVEYEAVVASHGLTHSAIRTVLDLGVDGIWFYAWRTGTSNEDDAVYRWLDQQDYAEAVETEIHDRDFLVTSIDSNGNSKIFISDIENNQSPVEGSEFDFNNNVNAIASGDFQGSNDLDGNTILYDLSYRFDEGFRSNGDGDDELVTAFNNGNIYFDENANQPDHLPINSGQDSVLAMTSGDFDGDGDYELVTAIENGNTCRIYVSDDASVGSVKGYQIYSSDSFRVTALTSGDFDGDGRDKLVTAISNSQLTDSYIYVDDISTTGIAINGQPWYGPDNEMHVTSLTAGDFTDDKTFRDMLVFTLSNVDLMNTKIYCTDRNSFSFDSSLVIFGPDDTWHVTSMTTGDYSDDNKITKELVIAFSNTSFDHSTIYKTGDPVVIGIGTMIYDSGPSSNNYVSGMTSASFRESLHPVTSVHENGGSGNQTSMVKEFKLYQNYPNPFNPTTHIGFTISSASAGGLITLKVYDILGNEVATLVNEEKPAGYYEINFNAKNLSSGIYFYKLQAGNFVQVKKMALLK